MLSGVHEVAEMSSGAPEGTSGRGALAPYRDRPVKVLVLIPTLEVGGAEMDLVRTLPRIDRDRFHVTVCTFLAGGELTKVLRELGIDVVGPFSPSLYALRQFLRRIAGRILSATKRASPIAKLYHLCQRLCLAGRDIFSKLRQRARAVGIRMGLRTLQPGLRALQRMITRSFKLALYTPPSVAYLLEVVRLARPIASHIRASEVDVVHAILPNSYLVGSCASALAGRRPMLMSRLSLNLYQQEYRMIGFIERRVLHRRVDAVIGNSKAVLQDLRIEGVEESKLHLVHNGIDARAFAKAMVDRSAARRRLDIPEGALVFSVVANLHPYKGHGDLLRALSAVTELLPSDWRCLIVGKDVGGHLRELERRCRDYGLSRHIAFLGPRADVPVILSASDIHVSASHQEGLPNNIIEAMCARLPVVATAVGGVPELVVDGQTGYLLPPRDVGRMIDALANLAQSTARRRAFGEAGYARAVSRFSIDSNVRAFESIYAGLARARSHDRSGSRSLRRSLHLARP